MSKHIKEYFADNANKLSTILLEPGTGKYAHFTAGCFLDIRCVSLKT